MPLKWIKEELIYEFLTRTGFSLGIYGEVNVDNLGQSVCCLPGAVQTSYEPVGLSGRAVEEVSSSEGSSGCDS